MGRGGEIGGREAAYVLGVAGVDGCYSHNCKVEGVYFSRDDCLEA